MDALTTTASAGIFASLITSLFKFGFPNLPSSVVMGISILAGILSAFLVSLSRGDVLSVQTIAANVLMGILAAGAAAGVSRADRAADIKREFVRQQNNMV